MDKTVFIFENKKETMIYSEWESGQWIEYSKEEYFYNDQNNYTKHLRYSPASSGEWDPEYKQEVIYDESGVAPKYEYEYWYEENQWRLISEYEIISIVDPDRPELLLSSSYYQINNDGTKRPSIKFTYTYDDKGRYLSESYALYIEGKWIPMSRKTCEYDELDKITCYYDENWDEELQLWYPDESKILFNYNKQGKISSLDFYEVDHTGTWDMSAWVFQTIFYNPNNETDISVMNPDSEITVYTKDKTIYINSQSDQATSIKIYNLNGVLVRQQQLNGALSQVECSGIPSGIYIVQINTFEKTKTVKVLIH